MEKSQIEDPGGPRLTQLLVTDGNGGQRLDQFLANRLPGISRSKLQRWIDDGHVHVDGKRIKAGQKLKTGQTVCIAVQPPADSDPQPETIPFTIYYEDKHIIVLEKPAGMMVHPAAGKLTGTLVNALLAHTRDLSPGGAHDRPGIVHRLDRDTSGLLVVAKTERAHLCLAAEFKQRQVEKRYFAVVHGQFRQEGLIIDRKIARDPRQPNRMSVQREIGRDAVTIVTPIGKFGQFSALDVQILTGRTHQIRVHLASVGYPVIGDGLYGKWRPGKALTAAVAELRGFALHARALSFLHPETGGRLQFISPPPPRFRALLQAIGAWGQLRFSGPEPSGLDVTEPPLEPDSD